MSQTIRQLGEVCEIIAGQHIESALYSNTEDGHPYLTGPADFGNTRPIVTKWTKHPKVFAARGDVLVTVKGNGVGKINLGCDAAIGRQLMALRPRSNQMDQAYLFQVLRAAQRHLNGLAQGATVPGIGKEDLASLKAHVPPLAEQKRIAGILDAADALRAKRREALAQLDTLLQATFLELFGDPVTNPMGWKGGCFDDLLTLVQYGPRFFNEAYTPTGVRIVRITDLDFKGNLDFEAMPRLEVPPSDVDSYALRPGDLILARTGATVGKTALIRSSDPECIAGAYFIRMRFKPDVTPLYVQWVMKSRGVQAIIWQKSQQSAQPNFNGPAIRKLPLPVPPTGIQVKFASIVNSIEKQIVRMRAQLAELDALFASLQSRAFRGEL